jgi:ATP adenylyltransferase
MAGDAIYAPWRMDYIKSLGSGKRDEGCFLCKAAAAVTADEEAAALLLWKTELSVVLINRYPYANGHLLVAPRRHVAELEELTADELGDVSRQTVSVVTLLKKGVSAQGFNIGINLGRVAGAGVPGHLHQHIVPRWGGDINFMHVIGQVSVVPQANNQLYAELKRLIAP